MSKIQNGGLVQYGTEPFERQQFGTAGIEGAELSVTLPNLNQFSKLWHCWKAYRICYKTYSTLPASP